MRPSSAETSEPACVKRKMLSMNSSTSCAFLVAEVLGHGQAGQADAQARAGRLVHLAEDQRRLGLLPVLGIDDAGLLHLQPQVVALAGALAHAGEHREAAVLQGDVVDQLHDDDGLADAGAAEQADLAALQVGLQQVDHLDAGLEHLQVRRSARRRRARGGGWDSVLSVWIGPILSTGGRPR